MTKTEQFEDPGFADEAPATEPDRTKVNYSKRTVPLSGAALENIGQSDWRDEHSRVVFPIGIRLISSRPLAFYGATLLP